MTDRIKEIVEELQKELIAQGYKPGKVDGLMGTLTFQAVRKHQNKPSVPPLPSRPPKAISWRLARSLVTLRAQIDEMHPKRNKASDGTIGDAVHAAKSSDHNPWVIASDGSRVVTALDITNDPANGVYCSVLANAVLKDSRVKYVIWNGKIWNKDIAKEWRKYNGTNKHDLHMHISVHSEEISFDNIGRWKLDD